MGVRRLIHVNVECSNLDVKILGAPVSLPVGSHQIRAFLFEDPDGVLIEFAEFV